MFHGESPRAERTRLRFCPATYGESNQAKAIFTRLPGVVKQASTYRSGAGRPVAAFDQPEMKEAAN